MTKDKEVIFEKDRIIIKDNPSLFVMMDWERELMKAHVDILPNGDILEIGFGMGISSQYIQDKGVKSHSICEVNPQILEKLKEWSKDKPNVIIIEGDWVETLPKTNKTFDGIFYDADCRNISEVRRVVEPLLNSEGVFTYFEPQGYDRYGFRERLKVETITISCDIPRNIYHNNKLCKVPYYVK
jgi:hypothetical protein